MSISAKQYVENVIEKVKRQNKGEDEFIQAVEEVLTSLTPFIEKNPQYIEANILERIVEPERIIMFKVPWEDDNGNIQVNRGYRVEFNGVIGPYKGGLRFHPTVTLGAMKFLGFEQTFKNSLTGLPIGGGKGGSDFNSTDKSEREIKRFCESFMTELYRHIGPDKDVPAGDIGVSGKEIGYLFGHYRRIKGAYENGVLTGKHLNYGGSKIRPEATGYGLTYFTQEILKDMGETFEGKTVAVSGYGNVAWGTAEKMTELGAKVVTISGSKGYVYAKDGLTKEQIDYMLVLRANKDVTLKDFAEKFGLEYFPGQKPWGVKVDIAAPCAIQNEIVLEDAKLLVANGVKVVCEGANMPCSNEAIDLFEKSGVKFGAAKAANAGGVAVSALEMSQNSMRYQWSEEEVDKKLQEIMKGIYQKAKEMSEEYGVTLAAGANIAGFKKGADTMLMQGNY